MQVGRLKKRSDKKPSEKKKTAQRIPPTTKPSDQAVNLQ
jgi:hypothetical protein